MLKMLKMCFSHWLGDACVVCPVFVQSGVERMHEHKTQQAAAKSPAVCS